MKIIDGGVCAPVGFRAAGVCCGIKNFSKNDLAVIISDTKAAAACVYTTNLVKGAPIYVTRNHVRDGFARAIIVNSGNANTCNDNGIEIAEGMCELTADAFGIDATDVIVASTGVIGQKLSLEPIKRGVAELAAKLPGCYDSDGAARAIMTTDTVKKETAVQFSLGGKICRMGGIAKGSGMISPKMATMLVFITTDANIAADALQKAISEDVQDSFNMLSVDGDTSTNDMLTILANGLAGNEQITEDSPDYAVFRGALSVITRKLCRMVARDGEGATKLLECTVGGAKSDGDARKIAKAVINSPLVKTAMFGADANWGRVLCAIGYSGAAVDVDKVSVSFLSDGGEVFVCENGRGIDFSEELAKKVLSADEITIKITLGDGNCSAAAYGCDLTYDYVKINGDYRT